MKTVDLLRFLAEKGNGPLLDEETSVSAVFFQMRRDETAYFSRITTNQRPESYSLEKKPVETTSYEIELGGVARVIKSLKKMSKNDPFL